MLFRSPTEPWLESPPLPQWVTVLVAIPFGRCDTVGIVRIGPMLVATGVVLMTAWMASLWFGRSLGLLAGLVLMFGIIRLTRGKG